MRKQHPLSTAPARVLRVRLLLLAVPLVLLPIPSARAQDDLEAYARATCRRHAVGMYLHGQKVGWNVTERRLEARNGVLRVVDSSEFGMVMLGGGERNESRELATAVHSLESPGSLVEFTLRSKEDGSELEVDARLEGEELVIRSRSGTGHETVRRVPRSRDDLALGLRFQRWLEDPARRPEDEFASFDFTWDRPDVDVPAHFEYRGRRRADVAGVEQVVFDAWVVIDGVAGDATILSDGSIVRFTMEGGAIELRAEPEEAVRDFAPAQDLLARSTIEVERRLGDPEDVTFLRLRVTGHGDFAFPASERQRVLVDEDGSLLVDLHSAQPAGRGALSDEERARYLACTPTLQCDAPAVRDLAARLAPERAAPSERIRRLLEWVDGEIEDSLSRNAPTALHVLENRAGDCTEHSWLFVALARAAGLPARPVGGVVYIEEERRGAFAWHEWAEVHDGDEWRAVDPTWGQLRADATHLKLSQGESDFSWVGLLGNVRIEILAVGR